VRRRGHTGLLFDGQERLQRFVADEWPPAAGECLERWACRDDGYDRPCVSRSGPCGSAHYEHYAGQGELLARSARADAAQRWRLARRQWLDSQGLDSFATYMADEAVVSQQQRGHP
jgi:hypothetical protein